ncbi:hypothetical protein ACFV6U_18245, partial [Streptomyces sp. NPDC059810]
MGEEREALIVQAEEAERIPLPHGGGFVLLADARDTGGALGANRLTRGPGGARAPPPPARP